MVKGQRRWLIKIEPAGSVCIAAGLQFSGFPLAQERQVDYADDPTTRVAARVATPSNEGPTSTVPGSRE